MTIPSHCTLRWNAVSGFDLDLSCSKSDVVIHMAGIPVPADGTVELLAEGVVLHNLDILFKATVDWEGAPSQLQSASVQLIKDQSQLHLVAVVEDPESGERCNLECDLPVVLKGSPPKRDGPRPIALEEDDLDWDDDETLEQMFGDLDLPINTASVPKPQIIEEPPEESAKPPVGLAALLKALSAPEPVTPKPAEAKAETTEDEDEEEGDLAEAPEFSEFHEARTFLELLIQREELELTEDGTLEPMLSGVSWIMNLREDSEAIAAQLSEWLLKQGEVDELYIDDESLGHLLEQW